ncbi:MAG: D-alanyl-D-alanine carboxypeptidase/D-alanyl-D-alanine-endopeptidase [Micropruina sp.]
MLLAVVVVAATALLAVPQWRAAVLPTATVVRNSQPPAGYRAPATAAPPALPLDELTPAAAPSANELLARLAKLKKGAAGTTSVVVADPQSGRILVNRGDKPAIPASTMKLLSALVAQETLGTDRTFATTVVSPRAGTVILRGGGDPLLVDGAVSGRASLQRLAGATATELARSGRTTVTLGYDATLFTGRSWHRHWTDNYRYSVAPIAALMVDGGRTRTGEAEKDPARTAAKKFAARLAKAGVTVTAVTPMKAPADAGPLAAVESASVEELIAHALTASDNTAIETLTRQAALATGRRADFAGAAATVASTLRRLGVWTSGMVIDDTCGLSRENRVTPGALVKAMRLAVTEERFHPLLAGLPVGGVTGTLADRFDGPRERAGRGVVRAKTGSLRDVTTLTGYLVTSDGAPLVFALVANKVSRSWEVRDWMDTTTARWAACGCG